MRTSSPTGFEVERESSKRSLENLAKAEYVASMQALDTAEETLARVAALEPEARAEVERLLAGAREKSRGLVIDAELEGEEIITHAELDATTSRWPHIHILRTSPRLRANRASKKAVRRARRRSPMSSPAPAPWRLRPSSISQLSRARSHSQASRLGRSIPRAFVCSLRASRRGSRTLPFGVSSTRFRTRT